MLKAAFRIASLASLAVALVAAVLDVTRSVANSAVVFTPLLSDWERISPDTIGAFQLAVIDNLPGFVWDPVAITLLRAPSWAAFMLITLVFAFLAKSRRQRWQENFQ